MSESDPIIQIEGLGKKYVLRHQQEGHGRYQSLRDTLGNGLRAAGRRLLNPFARTERPGREEFWALKDVSFEVKRGEVVGIIGRNGAGKSTLLKILSRITEPTAGRVTLRGRVASLLEVGTGFHPELTGRENVYLNGAILGMSGAEIKRKFDEIVAFAEVEKFLDTPVKRYSSGMYVRLAFAVAAHLEPEILVVDEVLAVGDAGFQKKCLGKMGDVARHGRTVLFVSHNMEAVQRLCQKGILMAGGVVLECGPVHIIANRYLSEVERGSGSRPRFSTDSSFTDMQVLVKGGMEGSALIWRTGEPLEIIVRLRARQLVPCPRVELAMYRQDGLKMFGVFGERLYREPPSECRHDWIFRFRVENLRSRSEQLSLDIGVRESLALSYSALWDQALQLTFDADGAGQFFSGDSIVLPSVSLDVD